MSIQSPSFSIRGLDIPIGLIVSVGIGSILRVYRLGAESLWIDEVFMITMATETGLRELLFEVPRFEPHPPLFNLFMWAWIRLTGTSEVAMRSPSVLFSILSIPVFYLLVDRLFTRQTAGIAAILLAVSPFQIWYAQEARMYALLLLLTVVSFYQLVTLLESPDTRQGILYVGTGVLLAYLHVYGLFVVLAQALFLGWLFFRRGTEVSFSLRQYIGLYTSIGTLSLPWTGLLLHRILVPERYPEDAAAWIQRPELTDLVEAFSLLSFGVTDHTRPYQILTQPPDLLLLVVVLSLLFVVGGVTMGEFRSDQRGMLLTWFWLFIPLFVPFFISLWIRPMFQLRYLIVVSPAFLLLLARGVQMVPQLPVRYLVVGLILTGMVFPLPGYYAEPNKDQWEDAAGYVASNADSGDVVIVVPGWTWTGPSDAFRHYFDREDVTVRPLYHSSPRADYEEAVRQGDSIYLVVSYTNQRQEVMTRVSEIVGKTPSERREYISVVVFEYRNATGS